MENVYSAPQADLSLTASDETYDPTVFSVNGRIGRLRYLAYGVLLTLIVYLFAGIAFAVTSLGSSGPNLAVLGILAIIVYIPALVFHFILIKRRLNDLNQSGWLSLIMIIPLVNIIFGLYILFAPGSKSSNDYGLPPSKNSTLVIIGGTILPVVFFIGILAAIALPAYQQYVLRAKAAQLQSQQNAPAAEQESPQGAPADGNSFPSDQAPATPQPAQ